MAIKLTKGLTKEWWTPEQFENEDDPPAFELLPLSGPQFLEVQQHFDVPNETVLGPGLMFAVRHGLKNWRNVVDDEGNDATFTARVVDRLPPDWLALIGSKIIALSVLEPDEVKNS